MHGELELNTTVYQILITPKRSMVSKTELNPHCLD
jgi:hypothetical protein